MSKLERLLNLTLLLLETERPLTIDELHEKVPGYPADPNSFRRSFERDKDDLREMGIPVQIEQLPGGRREPRRLPDPTRSVLPAGSRAPAR